METNKSAIKLKFKEAVEYFRQKVDVPTKHWTDIMDEAHARAFTVAGAADTAMLADFRKAVDKAIAEGTGYKEFKKDFDSIVAKYGWNHTGTADWRAQIIYKTNLSTAFAAGRYAQMTNPAVLSAFPYWQYQHVNCPNPRLQHLAWSGLVLRADDPWWDTHYPPNGFNCHCVVMNLGPRQLAAMGKDGPDQAPPMDWREYADRTTGRITVAPAGVDPGFAYNPGKAWLDKTAQPVKPLRVRPVELTPPPVRAIPGQAAVPAKALDAFLAGPSEGGVQIGLMHEPGLANAPAPVVLTPGAVKEAVAAEPGGGAAVIDAAAVKEIAAAAEAYAGNPHEKTRKVKAGALTAVLKWDNNDGVWLIVSLHELGAPAGQP